MIECIMLFVINVVGTMKVVGITFDHTFNQNISIQISGLSFTDLVKGD
jgi:hypothetical protein